MNTSRVYKGIEFVRISDLPEDQQIQLKNIDSSDLIIKIRTETELLTDCLMYKDYQHWFTSIYTKMSPVVEDVTPPKTTKLNLLTRLIHRLLPNT